MFKYFYLFLIVAVATKAEAQTSALAVADSLYAIGEYTGVIDKLEQVKDKSSKVYLMLARSHSAKGTLEDALANYKMAATGTDQAIAMTGYGKMLITKKKYKEADSVFTDLILAYAKNPNFYYQRGRAREKLRFQTENDTLALEGKVFSEATKAYLDDFKKTIALDSTHQKALAELASYHLKRKDYEQVEKLCKKALQSYPENVEVINLLAQNYFYKGWNKEAEDWFEKLIALGTETQFIYEKLGMSYYKDHYYDKAIDAYNKALQYSEEDWHLHGILAKLYNFTRDFEKAESHGKMALFLKTYRWMKIITPLQIRTASIKNGCSPWNISTRHSPKILTWKQQSMARRSLQITTTRTKKPCSSYMKAMWSDLINRMACLDLQKSASPSSRLKSS